MDEWQKEREKAGNTKRSFVGSCLVSLSYNPIEDNE